MKILISRLEKDNIWILFSVLLSIFAFKTLINFTVTSLILTIVIFLCNFWKPKYLLLSCLVFVLIFLFFTLFRTSNIDGKISGKFKVKKIMKNSFLAHKKNLNLLVMSNKKVSLGDDVFLSGKAIAPKNEFTNYMLSLNAKNVMWNPFVKIEVHSYNLTNKIYSYFNSSSSSWGKLMPLIVLGIKNNDNADFYNAVINLNLAHLFVISGLHMWMIFGGVMFLVKKMKWRIMKEFTCIIAIFFYIILIDFSLSAIRSFLMIIFSRLALYKKVKFSQVESLTLSLIVIVILMPYSIFGMSLVLSFSATFIVININKLEVSNFKKTLLLPITIYIFIFPMIISINKTFCPYSFIYMYLIGPIYPLIFLGSISIGWWETIWDPILSLLKNFIFLLQKTSISLSVPQTFIQNINLSYVFVLTSFIIYKVWNLFMEQKIT